MARVGVGMATAGLAYLLFDGFLVNRHGELIWSGTTSTCELLAYVESTPKEMHGA